MSLNLIAWGYGFKHLQEGDEIVLSVEEHASNIIPWYEIARLTKSKVVFCPLNKEGKITPDNLKEVLSEKTKIVALANVGNVLGYSLDTKEIAKVVHDHNAILVIDGAQSVPHMKTDFKDWDVDLLTFSAHKLCGPTGIGCLIGKYNILCDMNPFLVGGGMNVDFDIDLNMTPLNPPEKFEAGTQHLAGICGLKAAIEFIESIGLDAIHEHDAELNQYAVERLKENKDIIIYNEGANNGIVTFNIAGIFPEDQSTLLNSKGIAIRSGQHCAKLLHHHIKAKATCRMSTYLYTTKEEVDAFIDAVLSGGDILDAYFSN
jgi:cysteine desulfurase/selenocysteine lyase